MNLIITFSSDNERRVLPPAPPPLPIPLDGEICKDGGEIEGVLWPSDLISAQLKDYGGLDVKRKYLLRIASNSHVFASHAPASDISMTSNEEGEFWDEDYNDVKYKYAAKLLRGAVGKSFLVLWDIKAKKDIIYWKINIRSPQWQYELWGKMLQELLPFASPYVVSQQSGLSYGLINREWTAGEGLHDYAEIDTLFCELKKLLEKLAPYLEMIRRDSAMKITRKLIRVKNEKQRVLAKSLEIPIHCAIKDFFCVLLRDIIEVRRKIQKRNEEETTKKNSLPGNAKCGDSVRKLADEVEYREKIAAELSDLAKKCKIFLSDMYPWSKCKRLKASALSGREIPSSVAYRKVCHEILRYGNTRFFSLGLEGRFRVPMYKPGENDNASVWQKNYSAIYEVWVFKRLVDAFCKLGFPELLGEYRNGIVQKVRDIAFYGKYNSPIHASFSGVSAGADTEEMSVELIHDVLAYHGNSEFEVPQGPPKTPDFAIVFRSGGKVVWLVLDAKSGKRLEYYDIEKRDKYRDCRYKDEYTKQSWLIYSGRTDNIPRIEFDPTCENDGSWGKDCYVNFDHHNKEFSWDGENGIVGDFKSDTRCRVGHIRANAVNDLGNKTFLEFAQGQIATARRLLGSVQ